MNLGVILIQRLKYLDDPRVTGRCDDALADILVIALCALMAGAAGWDDIEGWGEAINLKRLETVLLEWIGHVCQELRGVIAIDGESQGFRVELSRPASAACGQRLRQ